MKHFDKSVKITHNPNWPYILDHLYRVLIIGGSGSGGSNVLLNSIKNQQANIDKICLHVKDPTDDAYEKLEDYNATKKSRVLFNCLIQIWNLIKN